MPKTGARTRAVKKDAVLEAAVDVARAGAEAVAYPRPVGEHVGFEMVSERLGTHYFASTDAGYVGWCWSVTVARVPRGRVATVCEVDMTPREGGTPRARVGAVGGAPAAFGYFARGHSALRG